MSLLAAPTRTAPPPPVQRELNRLQRLVEDQAGEIRDLKRALRGDFEPPPAWLLTRREAQVFAALVARERVSVESLVMLFYGETDCEAPELSLYSIVSKLRRKLTPFGIRIESRRHLGYRLLNRERIARTRK